MQRIFDPKSKTSITPELYIKTGSNADLNLLTLQSLDIAGVTTIDDNGSLTVGGDFRLGGSSGFVFSDAAGFINVTETPTFGQSVRLARDGSGFESFYAYPKMTHNSTSTVTFNSDSQSETVFNDSAATISSLTINLPSDTIAGATYTYFTHGICTLVSVNGSLIGANLTSLPADSSVIWQAFDSGDLIRIK